jgi:hypothetical protein
MKAGIDEFECRIEATFAFAKGGGEQGGPTRRGKGIIIMPIVARQGLPDSLRGCSGIVDSLPGQLPGIRPARGHVYPAKTILR